MTGPQSSRHLLSVLHAAERTGPPLLALQFLRWLRVERPSWQLTTLFLDSGGPLLEDFSELGPVIVNAPPEGAEPDRHPWLASGVRGRQVRRTLARLGQVDLAHVHCAGSMRAVPLLPPAPILCHIHELSIGQDFHLNDIAASNLRNATRYVAVSDGVRDELTVRFGIDVNQVERQWGFVDEKKLANAADTSSKPASDDRIVVLTSGVRNWRKAPEFFVRVAIRARELHPEINWQFRWIGGSDHAGLEAQITGLGLDDFLSFVPHQPDPLRWIADADIFLLCAREDAFPLVTVEAAGLGRPIVSFENGGTPELIRAAGCGIAVPFPQVDQICSALAELANNPAKRFSLGDAGRRFALENLVLAKAGPALLSTIERTMAQG